MPRVFVSAQLPGGAVEALRASCEVVLGEPGLGLLSPSFAAGAGSFDALLTLLTDTVDEALLGRAPRVRLVANMAVGFDNVDLAACRARQVTVTNTPGVLTEATADFAFALLLAAARRVAEGDRLVRAGGFHGWRPDLLLGTKVFGKTLGILGLGRIGQAVARRARGFGMHVLYHQRSRLAEPMERALGATYVALDDLFAAADFVSLHCPLTDSTRGLVSRARLAKMRPGAVLVNTARGACVDELALAEALAKGPLGAAGLDVFAGEEARAVHVPAALLACPNVVFAPHIASGDAETRAAMADRAAKNVLAFLSGATPPDAVG